VLLWGLIWLSDNSARSKAWVCVRLLAGIADSNPDEGMVVYIL
jgi:hypothetical protein